MSAKKPLDEVWAAAFAHPGVAFPVGRAVVCDLCSKDWTDSPLTGGFLFLSKGVCPDCAPRFMQDIVKYKEQEYIHATCPPGESFADMVRRMRGPDAFIRVTVSVGKP
jgi:hypothetical protein